MGAAIRTSVLNALNLIPATAGVGSALAVTAEATGDHLLLGSYQILDSNHLGSQLEVSSGTLQVAAAGITETELSSAVAGDGLAGGSGTVLSVDLSAASDVNLEFSSGKLRVKNALADSSGDSAVNLDNRQLVSADGNDQATWSNDGLTLASGASVNEFSTDSSLAGNSDDAVPTEKAVKTYVDNNGGGKFLDVVAAADSNIDISSAPATIDSTTLVSGDAVLLTSQTAGSENGVYVFNGTGSAMTRHVRADAAADFYGLVLAVAKSDGVYSQTTWSADHSTDTTPLTLGTTAVSFTRTDGASTITAGDGIDKSGQTLSVNVSGGIEISSDAVRIATSAAGTGITGGGGSALSIDLDTASDVNLEFSGGKLRVKNVLTDSAGATILDLDNQRLGAFGYIDVGDLYDPADNSKVLTSSTRVLSDSNNASALDFENRQLVSADGNDQATWSNDGLTLASGASVNEFSIDGTLAGNSDDAVPTEKAVVTYATKRVASSTDNALARFDGTTGQLQDSSITVDDNDVVHFSGQAYGTTVSLTNGATIATDCNLGNVFDVTLDGTSGTVASPTNLKNGATYIWVVRQDATGNRTVTWGSAFVWPQGIPADLSNNANEVDVVSGVSDGNYVYVDARTNLAIDFADIDGTVAFSQLADAANIARLDQAETVAAVWSFGANIPTVSADPTSGNQLARKSYVDSVSSGLLPKDACRLATTQDLDSEGNGTWAYDNGSSGLGATLTAGTAGTTSLDGNAVADGDRILVKNQTDAFENGIYVVSGAAVGSVTVLTRAVDSDNNSPDNEIRGGVHTFVQEGTVAEDLGFVVSSNGDITIGTSDINWTQFSGAGAFTAGDGLAQSGNNINVNVDDSTIEISTDTLQIKAAGVTETQLATSVAGDGLAGGAGTALSVNVDSSTIEISSDTLQVIAAGITAVQLAASVAGNGLAGGAGTALSVNVDGSSIEISTDTLQIKAAGVTETQLATSVAGDGLAGGAGTALSVNVDSSTIEISSDTLQIKALGIDNSHISTSAAIALSKLANDVVSQAEAEAGTATTRRLWTAQRVREAAEKAVGISGPATDAVVTAELRHVPASAFNLKATGQNTVYTVPTSRNFIVDQLDVIGAAATGVTTAPTVRILAGGSVIWGPTQLDAGLTAAGNRQVIDVATDQLDAADTLILDVTGAGGASGNYTARAVARGYELPALS